jgi:hypothetical protein
MSATICGTRQSEWVGNSARSVHVEMKTDTAGSMTFKRASDLNHHQSADISGCICRLDILYMLWRYFQAQLPSIGKTLELT